MNALCHRLLPLKCRGKMYWMSQIFTIQRPHFNCEMFKVIVWPIWHPLFAFIYLQGKLPTFECEWAIPNPIIFIDFFRCIFLLTPKWTDNLHLIEINDSIYIWIVLFVLIRFHFRHLARINCSYFITEMYSCEVIAKIAQKSHFQNALDFRLFINYVHRNGFTP